MPAPLIWLGAAALAAYTANHANTSFLKRKQVIDSMPGESTHVSVPINGSIVTCGIYSMLDHTGIWVDGNIYELSGKGLVRCLSPERFIGNRTGSKIYVACDIRNNVLFDIRACDRAKEKLFTLLDYHLLNENCHKFVATLLANDEVDITSFSSLNTFLSQFYETPIRWNLTKTSN